MTIESVLAQFDVMIEAPGGVQRLRELILQLAVRGRLVAQDSRDGAAATVVERARIQKADLARKRRLRDRGFRPLTPDEFPYALPSSWAWARLDDIGVELGQKVPDRPFSYIDVSSIDNARGVVGKDVRELEAAAAPSRARKQVEVGAVIYSMVRPYLLNVAVIDRRSDPEPIVSTAFAVLSPLASIEARYLLHYLRSGVFSAYVQREMTGMAYPAINDIKFFGGPVPLPPLAEQRRIVAKVDELMTLCDDMETRQQRRAEARERASRAVVLQLTTVSDEAAQTTAWRRLHESLGHIYNSPEMVAGLRAAVLELAVQGKLIPHNSIDAPVLPNPTHQHTGAPSNWSILRLGDVTEIVRGITFPGSAKAMTGAQGGVACLRTTNVQAEIDWDDLIYVPEEHVKRNDQWVRPGDLVISMANSLELVGKVALVRDVRLRSTFGGFLSVIRPSECLDPEYLFIVLRSPGMQGLIRSTASRTTNIANISLRGLRPLLLQLPPLAEQRRIVAKVSCLMTLCDHLETRLTHARDRATHLAAALVHRLTAA